MQHIKLVVAAACTVVAGSARLAAQQFDGVIQFVNYEHHEETPDTVTQFTKGSKIRFDGMGRKGGSMIFNGSSSIILIPEQKQWMALPPNFGGKAAAREAAKTHGVAVKTDRVEKVAGIPCTDWHYKRTDDEGKAEEGDVCVARGVGLQINRLTNGIAGQFFTDGGPEFAEAMKTSGVMKVTSNGKLSFEAVKAQAISVPDAIFTAPGDYTQMSMPGMRRPLK